MRYLTLFFALFLAACGDPPDDVTPTEDAMEATPTAPAPAEPALVDGVQTAEIEAGPSGYIPSAVRLESGIPARLIFTRTVESECSSQITVPAFDVPVTDLPLGEPVAIEFTPTETGAFSFVCGMGMQHGGLLVRS